MNRTDNCQTSFSDILENASVRQRIVKFGNAIGEVTVEANTR